MKIDSDEYKDTIDEIEADMAFLTERADSDIKLFEDTAGDGLNGIAPDEVDEQVKDMKDEFSDAVRIAKNTHALVDACAHHILKHPKDSKPIADILKRMHVEVTK